MVSIFAVAQPSPVTGNTNHENIDGGKQNDLKYGISPSNKLMGTLTHLAKDPFEFSPVTESNINSRTPRAISNTKFSGAVFFSCYKLKHFSKAFLYENVHIHLNSS